MRRTSALASVMLLVLVLPVVAESEEEDYDMDMLLDVLRRTRGKPYTPTSSTSQSPFAAVWPTAFDSCIH